MDRLSQYLNDELSDKEQETITKKLLQNHYDKQSKEKWSQLLEEKYKVAPPQKNKAIRIKQFLKIGLIAASILLLFLVGKVYHNSPDQIIAQLDTQELVQVYLAEKYDYSNLKKSLGPDDLRAKASHAYTIGDYKLAIAYYQEIPNPKGEDFVFLGLSFLYNDQADQAIPLLNKVIELVPFEGFRVADEFRWQLSLAYLKNEQFEKARIELEQLANNKSSRRKLEAEKVLNTLKD